MAGQKSPKFFRALRVRAAWREVAATRAGQIVLADLFREAGLHQNPIVPGDSPGTHANIGRQYVAHYVIAQTRMSEEQIARTIEEQSYGSEEVSYGE